jgi:hypothetical protein
MTNPKDDYDNDNDNDEDEDESDDDIMILNKTTMAVKYSPCLYICVYTCVCVLPLMTSRTAPNNDNKDDGPGNGKPRRPTMA